MFPSEGLALRHSPKEFSTEGIAGRFPSSLTFLRKLLFASGFILRLPLLPPERACNIRWRPGNGRGETDRTLQIKSHTRQGKNDLRGSGHYRNDRRSSALRHRRNRSAHCSRTPDRILS